MVAYNLRKVEIRDRCPVPPLRYSRYSIGAVPRLVAPIAWVRFPVAAILFVLFGGFVLFFPFPALVDILGGPHKF